MTIKISSKLETKIKKNFREALHAISQQALAKKQVPTNAELLNYLIKLTDAAVTEHNVELNAKYRATTIFPNK